MQIISVKFQNLNSLKGEHEIHFNHSPFLESGLFAITGPTGAGKTTILDAITVALYGQVHRHDKDVEEIMSRHTAECYSEVEFEANGIVYRAKWSLRRSRGKIDGAMQAEKMELANAQTGALIGGHTLTLVKQAIKDVCGLDYNQFLRSVILCQGDFTRFLKAGDNERSDLLEKITDTGIYSEISRFVFDKQRAEKEKLDLLNASLAGVEVLEEEERNAFNDRLTELEKEDKVSKEQQSDILLKINSLKHVDQLREKKGKVEIDLQENLNLFDSNKANFERLALHVKALTFLPELAELTRLESESEETSSDLDALNRQLPEHFNAHATALFEFTQASENAATAQNNLSAFEPVFDAVVMLDADVKSSGSQVDKYLNQFQTSGAAVVSLLNGNVEKQRRLLEIKTQQTHLEEWLKLNDFDKNLDKQIAVLSQIINSLDQLTLTINSSSAEQLNINKLVEEAASAIAKNSLEIELLEKEFGLNSNLLSQLKAKFETDLNGKKLEDLELQISQLPSLISNCDQQKRLADSFKKNTEIEVLYKLELVHLNKKYTEQSEVLLLLGTEKTAAENHLEDLRSLVELEQRIQNYDEDRKLLKPEEPCFLCGSIHHPFVEGNYQSGLSNAEKKRNEQAQNVSLLVANYNAKSIEVNALKLKVEAKQNELDNLVSDKENLINEFNEVNLLLPKALDIGNLEVITAIINKKKQQLAQLQKQVSTLRRLQQDISETEKAASAKKEAIIAAKGKAEALTEKVTSLQESSNRIELALEDSASKRNTLLKDIETLLAPYGVEFDSVQPEKVSSVLRHRFESYIKSLNEFQQNKLSYIQLKTDLESAAKLWIEKAEELRLQESELNKEQEKFRSLKTKRHDLFQDKDPMLEREHLGKALKFSQESKEQAQELLRSKQEKVTLSETKIKELTSERSKLASSLQNHSDSLLEKLRKESIVSVSALKALFLSDDEAKNISTLESHIKTSIAASQQLLATLNDELRLETSKAIGSETLEQLALRLSEIEISISQLNQEIGRIKEKTDEDDRLKLKFAEIATQLQIQKKEFAKWAKLSDLIGSADGKKFRRFAQGLTLVRLTNLANRHLMKLSDRYRILKSKVNDLELLIIDGHQADAVRPMATLSGGESFLVSLALALGLSDLASHKVQINSLFIDEGFGTLDADTLDIAISALENLQAKGKTIGIISHVEALKERIGTQIQLTKQPGGSSKIKVLSYANATFES